MVVTRIGEWLLCSWAIATLSAGGMPAPKHVQAEVLN
jgi:hypothetical protein